MYTLSIRCKRCGKHPLKLEIFWPREKDQPHGYVGHRMYRVSCCYLEEAAKLEDLRLFEIDLTDRIKLSKVREVVLQQHDTQEILEHLLNVGCSCEDGQTECPNCSAQTLIEQVVEILTEEDQL